MDDGRGTATAGDHARTLVLRLWLPDRPGALGQVASRIGSVHGDLLAIDILERGGGQVVDELVILVPSGTSDELLVREVRAVDGVAVEDLRVVDADRRDPAMAMSEVGAAVAEAEPADAVEILCAGLLRALEADWAAVVGDGAVIGRAGAAPDAAWLSAFVDGSGHLASSGGEPEAGPGDLLWASMPAAGLTVAVGRGARAIHERERARLHVLARTLDRLLALRPAAPPARRTRHELRPDRRPGGVGKADDARHPLGASHVWPARGHGCLLLNGVRGGRRDGSGRADAPSASAPPRSGRDPSHFAIWARTAPDPGLCRAQKRVWERPRPDPTARTRR